MMERFGPFEVGRVLDSGSGATVYDASKEGDSKGRFIVKVFSPERLLTEEETPERTQLSHLFKDLVDVCSQRIEFQKQAAAGSRLFIPILANGQDERGAWYASPFCARSVKGMLDRFVALGAADLFHIVNSSVKAALHLKKTAGRSHGNLKPSNIFIEGVRRPRDSHVMVADPMEGGPEDSQRYERADLRAIGEVIYQLVFKKKVDFGWVILPLESSPEWETVFGKKTQGWLDLCNKLLNKHLSLDQVSLESVAAELSRLEPKPPVPIVPVAVGAGVLALVAIAAFLFLHRRNTGVLLIQTDPPGARVSVMALLEGYNEVDPARSLTNTTALNGSWKARLEKGRYRVKVEYKSSFGDLPSPHSVEIGLGAGQTVRSNFTLPYGGLVVRSEPPGAEFKLNGQNIQTPFTNRYLQPAEIAFQLRLAEYETTNLNRTIPSNGTLVEVAVKLRKPPPGSALVEFASDPPGADVYVDGVKRGKAGDRVSIDAGPHELSAELLPWFTRQSRQFQVQLGQNPVQSFYFPHGVLDVSTSSPPVVQLFVNGTLAGLSPTNLNLSPGTYQLSFQAEGYETNQQQVVVTDRTVSPIAPTLKPLAGFVFLSSQPPGAQILGAGGQLLTNTSPGVITRLALPPGTNQLTISFTNLDPVWTTNVIVRSGQSNELGVFRFRFGTVVFTNGQPRELPPDLPIRPETGAAARFGDQLYQRPGANLTYRVELADYDPWTVRVSVPENGLTNVPVRLERRKLPVVLEGNLEGTSYSYQDEESRVTELGAGTNFNLPWGTNLIVARLSNLQPLSRTVAVPRSGTVHESFQFSQYGLVITTNLTPGTEIMESNGPTLLRLGKAPAPVYSRPGDVTFLLSSGGAPLPVSTNVVLAGWIVLTQPMPPITSSGSGIEFYWVPGLPDTPSGAYVGRTEVTQEQYDKIMQNDSSDFKDPKLPVNNLDPTSAERFCTLLTERDKGATWIGKGYHYALPTIVQWDYLTNAARPDLGVFSPSATSRLDRPSPPGTKPPDGNGLYDVYGNVWELCRGPAAGDYRIRGGCYEITTTALRLMRMQSLDRFDTPKRQVGFRVIALPPGS